MSKTPSPEAAGSGHSTGSGHKAIVHITKTHKMTGVVSDEHFHVDDVIHNGVSAASLADRPIYYPIPLSVIAEKGHRVEYID